MAKQIKGILGEKLGMTQVWDANNRVVPVTVVKAGPNVVTQVRTNDVDGYESVQIAFGEIDPRKVNKPLKGHFAKADVTPRRHLVEIRTSDASEYTLGQKVNPWVPARCHDRLQVALVRRQAVQGLRQGRRRHPSDDDVRHGARRHRQGRDRAHP
ncbi:Large ribosomal subunit protein uL3 OS=Streptomyces albaduncus OX=68172 GN=rplC PE=3 SV=1 [Streptomyces griseoloalbus]